MAGTAPGTINPERKRELERQAMQRTSEEWLELALCNDRRGRRGLAYRYLELAVFAEEREGREGC